MTPFQADGLGLLKKNSKVLWRGVDDPWFGRCTKFKRFLEWEKGFNQWT